MVLNIFVAIVSLFGFFGCISRKVTLINVYNVASWVLLAVNLIATIIAIYEGCVQIDISAASLFRSRHGYCR
jgi:hypothetical protein